MRIFLKKRDWSMAVVFALLVSMVFSVSAYAAGKTDASDCLSRYITVDNKKMHVVLYGNTDPSEQDFADKTKTTLVMLPALGVPSPHIYFKPLAEALEQDFNVVIPEPFGYGLSDQTSAERTVANINKEMNDALDVLGIDECVLLVHSISGVYGLNFVYDYPEKVKGFIAVDNTVYDEGLAEALAMEQEYMLEESKKFDALRNTFDSAEAFADAVRENPEEYGAVLPEIDGYAYSESDEEEYIKACCTCSNSTIIDEIQHMDQSLTTIKDKKFPDALPVLTMVCSDNVSAIPAWKTGHENQLNMETGRHEIHVVEGGHYIWYTNLTGITGHIDAWREANHF